MNLSGYIVALPKSFLEKKGNSTIATSLFKVSDELLVDVRKCLENSMRSSHI